MFYHYLMGDLILLNNPQSREEQIKQRIERFKADFLSTDEDIENVNQILDMCMDYLSQYIEDPTLQQAYIRLNESILWLYNFENGIDVDEIE